MTDPLSTAEDLDPYAPYYILMVRSGRELRLREQMIEKRLAPIVPVIATMETPRHRSSKLPVSVVRPLLNGYLFLDALTSPPFDHLRLFEDVLKVVTFGGNPAIILWRELANVLALARLMEQNAEQRGKQRRDKHGWPSNLQPGEPIAITHGELRLVGTYIGRKQMAVNVENGVIRINIKHAHVERLEPQGLATLTSANNALSSSVNLG